MMEHEPEEKMTYTESAKVDNIKKFLSEFKDKSGKYKYIEKIDTLSGSNVMIELLDLFDFERESTNGFKIWEYFSKQSSEAIRLCKRAVKEVYATSHGFEHSESLDLNILIDKSETEISVSQAIKKKYLNKLVSIDCRIHGETEIKHKIIDGQWICPDGHYSVGIENPPVCSNSNCKFRTLELDTEKTKIESYRTYYVKDLEYSNHHLDSLIVEITGSLMDTTKMGEIAKLTGYTTLQKKDKKIYVVFHALNVSKPDEMSLEITKDDIDYFIKLANTQGHYEKLIRSIAPGVYRSELLKEAFLLSYVGSPKWDEDQKYWINVLAVGDPATAKSKIAQWASNNLENVQFVSSKAGSPKGLFAGQKEQADGQKVLEVGPMVSLSGRGLLCIDEFARMPEVFGIFYTPMESGSFVSATVGAHEPLNAETPIYATGNPHKSNMWDDDRSVIDNLQVFEPSMLSRFDLIIICKDEMTTDDRRLMALSILGQNKTHSNTERGILSTETLTKFCKFVKTIHPILTEEISMLIADTFVDVMIKKQAGMRNQETNTRFVSKMARITLAIARLHLHKEATIEDFQRAHDLIKLELAQTGLQASNANTYLERVSRLAFKALEGSITSLTYPEIYDKIFDDYEGDKATLLNDVGEGGPLTSQNKKWRMIMEYVERSYMVEVESHKPKKLRWKHEQK